MAEQTQQQHSGSWFTPARQYLDRLAQSEYRQQLAAHKKAKRSPKTFRYSPSEYHRQLVEMLGQDDEHGFQALKMQQGYSSAVQV